MSAVAVLEALTEAGHRVIPVGIDRSGQWFVAEAARRPLQASGRPAVLSVPGGVLHAGNDEIEFDVVFPVLHGPFGEDGTVQGLFEITGVPYVGCDVLGSALAMEKDVAKRLFTKAGLPTVRWEVVHDGAFREGPHGEVERVVESLGLPVFVKPSSLGSSVGVSKSESEAEVKEGLEEALRFGAKVLVEEAVAGREIEVGVLEGPRTSLPGEILVKTGWYSYEAKYHDESSRFVTPADLSNSRTSEVRDLAARAFTTLECRGLARIDFFLEEEGRGFLLNEVNTMPGFTPISGFPMMWEATGLSYPALCNELVELALR